MSDGLNEARSIATRPSSVSGAPLKASAQGTRSASEPAGGDLHDAGHDPGGGRGSSADGHANPSRASDPQHEVSRDDGELERLRLAARDGADRQLEPPGRHVANDERARRVPARPLPDAEAERRRLSGDLADRRRTEPERAGADRGRRRPALLCVPDEQAVERRPVEARPHLGEKRSGPGDRRRRTARAVDRPVERRPVRGGSRLRRRERDPGRGDVGLDAAVEGEPERGEAGHLPSLPVRVVMPAADRDADVEAGALRREQLDRRGGRDDDDRHGLVLRDAERSRRQRRAVEDDGGGACARRRDRGRLRVAACRHDGCAAGDQAEALRARSSRRSASRPRPSSNGAPRRGGSANARGRPPRAAVSARRG